MPLSTKWASFNMALTWPYGIANFLLGHLMCCKLEMKPESLFFVLHWNVRFLPPLSQQILKTSVYSVIILRTTIVNQKTCTLNEVVLCNWSGKQFGEGWWWWEWLPCVKAIAWVQGGLLQGEDALREAACSRQKLEHAWPMDVTCDTGGILCGDWPAWDGYRRLDCRFWCY